MLNLYYASCVLKVVWRRLFCRRQYPSWTLLYEIEVEFLRGFCPIRHYNDAFRKRDILENLVAITDIRDGLKYSDFICEHLLITEITVPSRSLPFILLYFHGGSFCFGSIETHREFCSALTKMLGCTTYLINYRLAPEHPFPAALEDAQLSYTWLLTHLQKNPNEIIVVGDCSGGGLALSLCLSLKNTQIPLPRALILLSPLVNNKISSTLTKKETSYHKSDTFDIFTIHEDFILSSLYCQSENPEHPYISPIFGDLRDLPPTLIQIGGVENRRDSVVEFVQRALSQGVPITLEIYEHEVRCFHMIEGSSNRDLAMTKINDFVRKLCYNDQCDFSVNDHMKKQ